MGGYLANAACNGRRPKRVGPQRIYSRPRLVKRLVSERGVARFIIAPTGFGKTSLGLEYAGSMFSFQGVHWLDCQSPCFLRDLDAGLIARAISESPEAVALVVFDDVPYLDDVRSAQFSDEIDSILERGCEVLAITTPAFGAIAELQRDSVVIGARDLLIDDAELVSSRVSDADCLRECDRVPAFLWGGAEGMHDFLKGMRLGEMPAEMRAPVFVMEALQSGSFDDLSVVSGGVRADARRFISEHYPYVGVDLADETFEAHGLDISQVVEGLGDSLDSIGRAATPASRDALTARVACMLASRGLGQRACEVMRAASARKRRIAWLVQQQWPLFDAGCVGPAQELFESLGSRTSGLDAAMVAAAAARLVVLGDSHAAANLAARALGMSGVCDSDSFSCALIALLSSEGEAQAKAREVLEERASRESRLSHDAADRLAAASALRLCEGNAEAAYDAYASRAAAADAPSRASAVYLAYLLERLPASDIPSWAEPAIDFAEAALRGFVERGGRPATSEALVAAALAHCGRDPRHPVARSRVCDDIMLALAVQRRERERRAKPSSKPEMRVGVPSAQQPAATVIPEARVRVFGGMDVSIGGVPVEPSAFSKQRTKTLLAVLTLFRGKEVPRKELLSILWPGMDEQRATNNFYSLWCKLRSALGAGKADDCPYVVRHRASVMLDLRYVKTDVEEFEVLYRALMFDEPNARAWMAIFERMEEEFSCDLLPSETENRFIDAMRVKYRTRRIDAYVTAAMRLVDAGEAAAALWFANAAMDAQPGREDVYFALMRAQAGNGQRVQAMETYHACGAYLSEHLGIDPSERLTDFYAGLLEGKESRKGKR